MNTSYVLFNQKYSLKHLIFLVFFAFLIRALTFSYYVQHNQRYKQPDSSDYHISAFSISHGKGMFHPQTNKPLFWRTPGYPAYLAFFYNLYPTQDVKFEGNMQAQKASLWVQIALCSLQPLLVFFLALFLTHSTLVAWISSWIFALHPGFILASCYLLTDGLALLFFLLFLLFFYASFIVLKEERILSKNKFLYTIVAALSLSFYTWMRPNGEFIALLALIILLFQTGNWKHRFIQFFLFFIVFFASLTPWYMRNHSLTGYWFFCPMSGAYHLAFSVPKILRRVHNKPLKACLNQMLYVLSHKLQKQELLMKLKNPTMFVSKEIICREIAFPILKKYPHYLCLDWSQEVLKTTFDLYSYQLVALNNNTFMYDPLEEFLSEKTKCCLYKSPLPFFMRVICWLELLFSILLWFGLLGGFIVFIIQAFIQMLRTKKPLTSITFLWLKTGIMIGGLLFMTGGFGYARLRMPAEPLMVIISLTFWLYLLKPKE